MFFMSKAKWNSLPPAAKKALEDNGGEKQSRAMGAFFDGEFGIARGNVQKMDKHAIVQLTPAQADVWRKAAAPVVEEWKKTRPGGEAVANRLIDTYTKLLADVKAGK
jgi:TRAP-type C4-dicarboxylate transport system substrate-binding protein